MRKPNYSREKDQKQQQKKRKREEKLQRKQLKREDGSIIEEGAEGTTEEGQDETANNEPLETPERP